MVHLAEHIFTVNVRAVKRYADRIKLRFLAVREYIRKTGYIQIGREEYNRAFLGIVDFLRNFKRGGCFAAAGSAANGNHLTHLRHLPQRKRPVFQGTCLQFRYLHGKQGLLGG